MTLIYLVVSYGKLQLPAFLPMVFFFSPLAFNRSGTSKVERNPLHDAGWLASCSNEKLFP